MKKALIIIIAYHSFFMIELKSQTIPPPSPYLQVESLVKTYQGNKIKRVMVNYKENEIVVITRKTSFTITKKQAAEAGIIAALPEIKRFEIESDIYSGVINTVAIKDIDWSKEKIVSDDGTIYLDKETNQYKAEVYLSDTAFFYKIDTKTLDTIGICEKAIAQLPKNEIQQPQISLGDIGKKLVTVELLKKQQEIKITPGYTFIKASVYFAGPNFKAVQLRQLSGVDLSPVQSLIDSCIAGCSIMFDNVLVKTPSGKLMRAAMPTITVGRFAPVFDFDFPKFQFGSISSARAESGRFKRQKKIYVLGEGYEFVSAVVYFSGAGFPLVNTATLQGSSLAPLYDLLQKCQPGTVVIFDNVKIKTPFDGIRVIDSPAYALF